MINHWPTEMRLLVSAFLTLTVAAYFFATTKGRLGRIVGIVLLLAALFLVFSSVDIHLHNRPSPR